MKKLLGAAMLCASFAVAAPGQAAPVVELGLAIDGSGSISSSDFQLQRQAYVNAIQNIVPTDGTVALAIVQFGSGSVQVEQSYIVINSAADIATVVGNLSVANFTQIGGNTPIGPAIQSLANTLLAQGNTAARQIIDVSTDGQGNSGINQVTAANNAITAGIEQVNCLGVGAGADCDFEAGVGSFQILASNFSAFQTALETKIAREVGVSVPEPMSLALFGVALAGLGLARRRAA